MPKTSCVWGRADIGISGSLIVFSKTSAAVEEGEKGRYVVKKNLKNKNIILTKVKPQNSENREKTTNVC